VSHLNLAIDATNRRKLTALTQPMGMACLEHLVSPRRRCRLYQLQLRQFHLRSTTLEGAETVVGAVLEVALGRPWRPLDNPCSRLTLMDHLPHLHAHSHLPQPHPQHCV
jgi:hypothetical protein